MATPRLSWPGPTNPHCTEPGIPQGTPYMRPGGKRWSGRVTTLHSACWNRAPPVLLAERPAFGSRGDGSGEWIRDFSCGRPQPILFGTSDAREASKRFQRENPVRRDKRRDRGAAIVEYTVLLALIAVVCILAFSALGSAIDDTLRDARAGADVSSDDGGGGDADGEGEGEGEED